jgi:hypothetical protein
VPLGFSALPLFFSSEKNNHPFPQILLKKERINDLAHYFGRIRSYVDSESNDTIGKKIQSGYLGVHFNAD